MAYEVQIAETMYDAAVGVPVRIAHPKFVPVLYGDLHAALLVAIEMLKARRAASVGRAFDYALAKLSFPILETATLTQVVDFVEKPTALHSVGYDIISHNDQYFPVHHGLERYFRGRTQIYEWLVNQLKMPNVPSAPSLKWIVPTMASWLEVVWLVWSGEVNREGEEYRVTYDLLQEEAECERYVRACSIAWLEHIRDKQPKDRIEARGQVPLGLPGALP
jgi:hypothetical protein